MDFWDGFIQSKWLSWRYFSPRKVNLKIGLISEDNLPRMAKSRKMTFRVWPNPGLGQVGISKEDLMKPAAFSHLPGTIDSGPKSLRLDKAVPGIL
jgi:hypothetical protein